MCHQLHVGIDLPDEPRSFAGDTQTKACFIRIPYARCEISNWTATLQQPFVYQKTFHQRKPTVQCFLAASCCPLCWEIWMARLVRHPTRSFWLHLILSPLSNHIQALVTPDMTELFPVLLLVLRSLVGQPQHFLSSLLNYCCIKINSVNNNIFLSETWSCKVLYGMPKAFAALQTLWPSVTTAIAASMVFRWVSLALAMAWIQILAHVVPPTQTLKVAFAATHFEMS